MPSMRGVIYYLVVIVLFLGILSFPVLSAQTISIVEKGQSPEPQQTLFQTVMSYWWVLIIIIAILGLLLWGLIILIKKIKEGQDVWFQIKKDKKKMCLIHKDRGRVRAFFKFEKNCPIRVCYTNSNQLHAKTVGYYRGHYLSHEGNLCILFNCRRKWLFLPLADILFINVKETHTLSKREAVTEGKNTKVVHIDYDVKFPHNFYQFTPDEVILYARGIDVDYRTGYFYPVLKDKYGNVINMALPVYESVKQIAIEGYLYDQTDDFVKVAKKSIDLNPMIRGVNKVSDSSSSIDTGEQSYR